MLLFPGVAALSVFTYAVSVAGAQVIAADLVVGVLLLVWGLSRMRGRITAPGRQVIIPLAALVLVCIVTLPVSPNVRFGVTKTIQRAEFLLFVFVVIALLRDRRLIRRTVDAYIYACIVLAVVTLFFAATKGIQRGGATDILFYNKNGIASFLCMALPLVVARILFKSSPHVIRWGFVALVIAGALLVTGSRGGWIGAVIALGVLTGLKNRTALLRYILVAGVLVAVLNSLLPDDLTRSSQFNTSHLVGSKATLATGGTVLSREILWGDAFGLIAAHPLLGVGVGGYLTFHTYQGDSYDFNTDDPHNAILYFWAELGTVGLIVFIWLIVAIFRTAAAARRATRGNPEYWIATGCLSALASYLIFTLTEPIWIRGDGLAFFLLVGICANLACGAVSRSRDDVTAGLSATTPLLSSHEAPR